jgi:protein-S-isoprenylcysteine O-methyltransferase Ste14
MREVVDRLQDNVARMTEQMQTLVRLEIQLAKTEMLEKAKSAAIGAAFFIAAGVLLFFSVFCLLIALIWAIGEFLPIWAGALIVMFVFIAIAGLLAFIGLRKAKAAGPPIPEKAIETVQPLPDEIKEAAHT